LIPADNAREAHVAMRAGGVEPQQATQLTNRPP
jgi:hypothetical protein